MPEFEDDKNAWNEVMHHIRIELGEETYNWWFNLMLISSVNGTLTVQAPSTFIKDQLIKKRYLSLIESKFLEIFEKKVTIVVEVENSAQFSENIPKIEPVRDPIQANSIKKKQSAQNKLKPEFTFENYIVGKNNQFAFNAALSVAKNLGKAYNPLLIYGDVGLGKTHLMQAIGNYVQNAPDKKIIFVTAENFMNEFTESISEKKPATFRNKYRNIDLLMLDDIHSFKSEAKATLEELFNTYEALHNANKQMVFTCDRPVSELKNFSERLKSRFENGLNVDLQIPEYETRCAILKSKIKNRNIEIPDDVIAFISKYITSNVRDLESALKKLTAYAELINKNITLEIAQEQLKDVILTPKLSNISMDIIQKVVAEYFNLTQNDLKGKKKSQNIVHPRHLAMFISHELTEYSTTEIGQAFGGRDHTTVMNAFDKMEKRIKSDPQEEPTIQTLIRSIKEYSVK